MQVPETQPDPNLFGRFYTRSVRKMNPDGTHKCYESEIWIEVKPKGTRLTSTSHGVLHQDGTPYTTYLRENKQPVPSDRYYQTKFPQAWAAFQNENYVEGTPLSHLPFLGPSDVDNFKAMGIRSAEDLANLDESAIHNIRNGRRIKATTKVYLDTIKKMANPDDTMERAIQTQIEANAPSPEQAQIVESTSAEEIQASAPKKVTKKKVTRKKSI